MITVIQINFFCYSESKILVSPFFPLKTVQPKPVSGHMKDYERLAYSSYFVAEY